MADSYSVKARLSALDSGFSSTLKNAIGLTDSFKSKISSIGTGILQGVGQKLFSGITSGISGMVSEMGEASGAWKTFEGNMSMLGKSAKEVQSVKKELSAFATESIYSASDMATTYAQLAAVGVGNTTELVKGFGGLAAAAENPTQAMKTLSQQATQMAAKPTVSWADFKLMLEQTPAGLAQVAKAMGMTTSELVTAVQSGTVATDEFFNAIIKAGGSGTELNKLATEYKTIEQAVGGLKETIATKLTPAFDVLSSIGIKGITKIVDALGGIDAQGLADKVSGWVKKATPYWNSFKNAVVKVSGVISGVVKKLSPIFSSFGSKIGGALKSIMDKIGSIDVASVVDKISSAIDKAKPYITAFANTFKAIGKAVAPVVKWLVKLGSAIVTYLLDNSEKLSKVIPYIVGAAAAFKGFKIVKALVPGMASFAKSIVSMATSGLTGLAQKLFGVAKGQKAAGSACQTSWAAMASAAKAFLMIGAGIALMAVGFGLLAQSAIALANAGWPAIAVMAGLTIAMVGMGIGMMVLLKTLSTVGPSALMAGGAMLMLGGAVLLIAVGFALLAQTAIALAAAGWPAIAVMIGMVAVMALLAVGAAVLGAALTAGAIGFLAFGVALLLVGVAALLAAVSITMIASAMPMLVAYGLQASLSLLALGAALLVFGAGALVAGAGALVLGAGLLVVAAAVLVLSAGILMLSLGCTIAAAALALVSLVLPQIAAYGTAGAVAILALGGALAVFAIGAGLAGAAALILGAGLLVASVGILLCAAGMAILAASVLIIGSMALIAATSFALMAAVLPLVTANSLKNALAMGVLAGGLTILGAAALVAGAGFVVLGAGLLVTAAGILAVALGAVALGVAIMAVSAGIALLTLSLNMLSVNAQQNAAALVLIGTAMLAFAAGTVVAGAAALVFSAGLLAATVVGIAFGVAMAASAIGVALLGVALEVVKSGMKSIAKNAKNAEKSLDNMMGAVDIVEAGLKGLGKLAESAMDKLAGVFADAAGDAIVSGTMLAVGFTMAMQGGLAKAPAVASSAITVVSIALLAGYAAVYNAGAYISKGFADGMLSQLRVIQSAANKIAEAADKAVRAKAKIHSPSKVAESLGSYWGEGYVGGLLNSRRDALKAAEELVSIPQVATPNLANAYGGELAADYNYANRVEYVIEVPLNVDRREFARAFASTFQEEGNRKQTREDRKLGRV